MAPGPALVRYRPEKDALGRVGRALRVPIVGRRESTDTPSDGVQALPIPDEWLVGLKVGDVLEAQDTRERRRRLRIIESSAGAVVAALERSCYLTDGAPLRWRRAGATLGVSTLAGLPRSPGSLQLRVGDHFLLELAPVPTTAGSRGPEPEGPWQELPRVGLEMGGVQVQLEVGQRVVLDDGKVEGIVESVGGRVAKVRVTRTLKERARIRGEKGVNFPDSAIRAPSLSPQDQAILPLAVELADLLGVSFVRTSEDLREAIRAIEAVAVGRRIGILVKLETAQALQSLPEILLEALRHYPTGVMIARGDLAVEVGFERLAELQQEILWFAEAAQLPVVWATQVLDSLARTGIPSRAEISDASMSVQAECVMLNKGPHVLDACRTLDTIIQEMEQHQFKKRNLYRPLQISLAMKAAPPEP